MSNSTYTVPALSLSNSRSRKNIPTKDALQPKNYSFDNKSPIISSNPYLQKKQDPKNNFTLETKTNYYNIASNLPPRSKFHQLPPSIPKKQVKQITRNVYLSSQDDNSAHQVQKSFEQIEQRQLGTNSYIELERARQVLSHSNSRGSLFRNPESRVEIQNQVMRQTNNMELKRLDINKALFDRKMAKIVQEMQFYDQELNGLYEDCLSDKLEELESIKKQNKQLHSKILQDLNKLIV